MLKDSKPSTEMREAFFIVWYSFLNLMHLPILTHFTCPLIFYFLNKPTLMKKIFFFMTAAALTACNSGDDKAKVESMAATDSTKNETVAVTYPYDIEYSSSFEIGDHNQAQTLLSIWKDWDNGNLANGRDNFADSVEMHLADGSMVKGPKDSVLASGQHYRDMFSKVVSTVTAVVPLKSTDKKEDWVTVWGKEIDTYKNGKIDSFYLQETWRFNKDGKADLVYQYMQKSPPAAKK